MLSGNRVTKSSVFYFVKGDKLPYGLWFGWLIPIFEYDDYKFAKLGMSIFILRRQYIRG